MATKKNIRSGLKHCITLSLCALAIAAFSRRAAAEGGVRSSSRGGGYNYFYDPYYQYSLPFDPREPVLLDDRVFDLDEKPSPQQDAEGHYLKHAANYSRSQRNEWIKECDYLKDVDFKKFQKCYHDRVDRYERNRNAPGVIPPR